MPEKFAEKRTEKIKTLFSVFFCLFCIASVLLFPSLTAGSIRRSLTRFTSRLIPALFPMMILSRRLLCSLPEGKNPVLLCLCRFLSLTPDALFLFLTGLLCGYPLPAVLSADLYRNGRLTSYEAERCAAFFDNASPGFLIAFVGNGLLGSAKYGVFLWFAQTLSVLCALKLFPISPKEKLSRAEQNPSRKREKTPLTEDIRESARILSEIAAFTAAFSLLADFTAAFLSALSVPLPIVSLAAGFSEITDGCAFLADCPKKVLFLLLPFLSGLGGLSVLCQVRTALPRTLSIRPYLFARGFIALLMTACFFVMMCISP